MIFANTFPKSGTGLLRQVLKPFGKDHLHLGIFDRATGMKHNRSVIKRTLIKLANEPDGFITSHLHWHPNYEQIIFPKCKMIMLIRDPREIIVSHVKYVRAMPDHNLHEYYMGYSEEECYWITMIGMPDTDMLVEFPNIADRFLPYLGWCKGHFDPRVLTISFQLLWEMPEQACRKIASFIYPSPRPAAEEFNILIGKMLAGIDPEKSNTYRPGDYKRWQDEMPEKVQEYFNEHFDWLLNLMNSKMYL